VFLKKGVLAGKNTAVKKGKKKVSSAYNSGFCSNSHSSGNLHHCKPRKQPTNPGASSTVDPYCRLAPERGLPCHELVPVARCARTHPFTLTRPILHWGWRSSLCCTFPLGPFISQAFTWRRDLWSPDFPPTKHLRRLKR